MKAFLQPQMRCMQHMQPYAAVLHVSMFQSGACIQPAHTCMPALQGLPLGSGMGSSAASAAAGAWAVNALFGAPLSRQQLVPAGLVSEATVSGYHADNIAPRPAGGLHPDQVLQYVCILCWPPSHKAEHMHDSACSSSSCR